MVLHYSDPENKYNVLSIPQKCQDDKRCTAHKKLKPGLHLNKVVTIAEQACDHVLKRVLKLSTYRLQIFLVKYECLRSLQLCEDKGIRKKLERNVFANMCLLSLQLIGKPGFKKMHETQLKNLPLKSSAFHN